jgi:hypothetical protein
VKEKSEDGPSNAHTATGENVMDAKTTTNEDIFRKILQLSKRCCYDNIPVICESELEATQRHRQFINFLLDTNKKATGFGGTWVEVIGISVSFVARPKPVAEKR